LVISIRNILFNNLWDNLIIMPVGSYCFPNGPKGHNIVYNTIPTLWLLTINLEVLFFGYIYFYWL
jgi:hypothetical protein